MESEINLNQLPKGWVRIKVGDIFEFVYGKGLVKSARNETGPYPVYGSSGVVGFHDQYVATGPKVIVGRKGAAGAVHYCNENFWPIDTTYFVNSINVVDSKFSYYLLKSLRLKQFETSTAVPGLNRDDAYRLDILLPPLNEQKRIVAKIEELFSELDNGIASLKTAREQLKVYRQSILKHAFEGKLTAKWREENANKLESPEQLLARIQKEREARYQQQLEEWKVAVKEWEAKDKEGKKPSKPRPLKAFGSLPENMNSILPVLPKTWQWGKLGILTTCVEYGTSAKSSESGLIPVIRMGNLQNGKIDWVDLVYSSDQEEIEKYLLKPNDVLFNRTNSPELVGKTAKYRGEQPAIFAGYLIRINQIDSIANSDYLNYFLNSHIAKQYGNTVKTDGVNQSNINGEKLQNYPFPFCAVEEQAKIVEILEGKLSLTESNIQEIEFQLAKAESLRQSILKKAFSGKLVPQDPNDEPASKLLARIWAEKEQQKSLASKSTTKHSHKKISKEA